MHSDRSVASYAIRATSRLATWTRKPPGVASEHSQTDLLVRTQASDAILHASKEVRRADMLTVGKGVLPWSLIPLCKPMTRQAPPPLYRCLRCLARPRFSDASCPSMGLLGRNIAIRPGARRTNEVSPGAVAESAHALPMLRSRRRDYSRLLSGEDLSPNPTAAGSRPRVRDVCVLSDTISSLQQPQHACCTACRVWGALCRICTQALLAVCLLAGLHLSSQQDRTSYYTCSPDFLLAHISGLCCISGGLRTP